ncbi:hypothetical protein BU17DRAFT_60167 [Hysterangium stoloniferum]|nr:hypothetical protein BU17DRAFT_60167 [Hysterangium stoloniferum]
MWACALWCFSVSLCGEFYPMSKESGAECSVCRVAIKGWDGQAYSNSRASLEFTPRLNTNGPSRSCMTASTSFSCLVENHAVHPAVTSYGPGAPPLSLQGPYDIMLSGTPRIFLKIFPWMWDTKPSSLSDAILEFTPRLNTNWPVFPFMHDCIYLIFTPGAKSRARRSPAKSAIV